MPIAHLLMVEFIFSNDYIVIAISAWLVFGIVSILEKFLLQKPISQPKVLAFYTGIFAIFPYLIFAPLAKYTNPAHLIFDLASGAVLFASQYTLYHALKNGPVSEVIPITGALTPIFALLLTRFGLGIFLFNSEIVAIILLALGTFLISYHEKIKSKTVLKYAIASSVAMAVYFVMVKVAYTPFTENFAFVRAGSIIAALSLLLSPAFRKELVQTKIMVQSQASALFISKEVLAGIAFMVLNYAISVGNPAIVNAAQGFEYVFIFAIAFILAKKFKMLQEYHNPRIIFRRLLAIILIFLGLIVLYF